MATRIELLTFGRELLRLEDEANRDFAQMGSNRRASIDTRTETLEWALHVLLTGDTTRPPGRELEEFLRALRASEGGSA